MVPRLRRLRAIVLHRTPVREKDRVVEVFSREEGRLKLLAAGVRRFPSRRAGHLEPLLESALVVSASARGDSIRDARVLRSFPRIREDLNRLRVAYYLAQLLREGTGEHFPDAHLYDAAHALFGALDRSGVPVTPLLVLSADIQLLQHLGSLPDASACTRCRRPLFKEAFSFDARAPGFVCRQCAPGVAVGPILTDAVKLLRLLAAHAVPPPRLRVPSAVIRELAVMIRLIREPLRTRLGLAASRVPVL